MLSAACGRAASMVFSVEPPVDVITTAAAIAEVEEYLPEFSKRFRVDLGMAELTLATLPIEIYTESDYISHKREARKYLAGRDPDDVDLAALALKFNVPIWSNDNDFDELPDTDVYTTAELLAALGIRSR